MRIPEIWMGDEASFEELLRTMVLVYRSPSPLFSDAGWATKLLAKDNGDGDGEDGESKTLTEFLAERITSLDGSVGVININGPMTPDVSLWSLFSGSIGYPVINKALETLSANEEVSSILLNLGTSGGDSVGVNDVSEGILKARSVKPVHAFSGSRALSAGYWIAASAEKIYGSKMAEFGSIGALTTHTSVARALKEDGIDVTVFRGGKDKALAHPTETLSARAKEVLQEKTDAVHGFFLDHVAESRGLSRKSFGAWGEGQVFFAEEAKSVGLVDEIVGLTDLLSKLNSKSDSSRKERPVMATQSTKKVVLSEQAAAALASGASLDQLPHQMAEETEEEQLPEATTTTAEATPPPAEDPIKPAVSATLESTESELVAFLKGELAAERTKSTELAQQVAGLTSKLEAASAAEESLKPLVIEATHKMMIGLNQTPIEMGALPSATVVSQYQSVKEAFSKTFRVGRQALSAEDSPAGLSPVSVARQFGITIKDSSASGKGVWGR